MILPGAVVKFDGTTHVVMQYIQLRRKYRIIPVEHIKGTAYKSTGKSFLVSKKVLEAKAETVGAFTNVTLTA